MDSVQSNRVGRCLGLNSARKYHAFDHGTRTCHQHGHILVHRNYIVLRIPCPMRRLAPKAVFVYVLRMSCKERRLELPCSAKLSNVCRRDVLDNAYSVLVGPEIFLCLFNQTPRGCKQLLSFRIPVVELWIHSGRVGKHLSNHLTGC